ncbi:putative GDSL-like lipase/acylhydrolase [Balamuthia mandrillaris]
MNNSGTETTRKKASLDMLAFGDSLTEGYYAGGRRFHPYSDHLQKLLTAANHETQIDQAGISGETVQEMVLRLPKLLKKRRDCHPLAPRYTHVIILGGTNDLGSRPADDIFQDICRLHDIVHQFGARSVAVTIPEASFTEKWYVEKRTAVNEALRAKVRQQQEEGGEGRWLFLDLEKELPYQGSKKHSKEGEGGEENLWDDALHMTPAGYDRFAALLFRVLTQEGESN